MLHEQTPWFRDERSGDVAAAAVAVPAHIVEAEFPPITSAGVGVLIVSVLMPLIATGWTGLRVWTRRLRGISPFLLEDILCYLGLLVFWGVGINYICMVVIGGGGYHLRELQPIQVKRFSQTTFAAQVLYALALGFTKNSLVCMLKRIFFTQNYAWIAYLVLSLNVAWMAQTILTGILICRPITMNWDPTARGHCGNQTYAFAAVSIVDIVTDLTILILPLRLVANLQMRKPYKVALMCVFGFGLITVVFTAIRLYFVFNLDFTDISFSSLPLTIIGVIQLCVANMVCSAPLLRPVLDRTVGKWLSLSIGNSSRETPRNGSAPVNRLISGDSSNTGLRKNIHSRSRLASGRGKDFERITESEENLRWELDVMHADKGQSAYAASPDVNNNNIGKVNAVPAGRILKIQSTEISRE
ncbi:GPCR, PTH11-type [Trichoderma sp. SZMC 28011]